MIPSIRQPRKLVETAYCTAVVQALTKRPPQRMPKPGRHRVGATTWQRGYAAGKAAGWIQATLEGLRAKAVER